ncbi:MAG: hypothetical protein MJZ26_14700 [Fibrobacter sp.]|nr:hypothetical protein [Fibrobacter sp.]
MSMRLVRSIFALVLFALLSVAFAHDEGAFKIDSIQYHIGDAFDDSKYHTKYDKWAYDVLNWIHIETRESTVRKLLLFNQGDYVDSLMLQESERFLRTQRYLSDASISVESVDGKNIAHVNTSDNWTLTLPVSIGFSGNEFSYDNLNYGIGIQESNFLGLGQTLGFYYGHDEFRDMLSLEYSDPHFLFRYNHLDVVYSYNTDGYLASWQMYVPYLSRSQNQWAYTLAGMKNERFAYFYGSGDMPKGAAPYETETKIKDLPLYNGDETVELIKVHDFIDDSLSFRFSRSFGGAYRKFYVGATYDYRNTTAEHGKTYRYLFTDGEGVYAIDSASAWNDWLPERTDSRLGLYLMLSNIRYEKIRNYHNVKWTEDVEKGYSLKAQVSKNYEQIGAADNDIRLDFWANMYLGRDMHHLVLKSESRFYLDHGNKHDYYGKIYGEYVFHPSNAFSTALSGQADFYEDTRLGYQLTLGGTDGFVGFPTGFYAGQARVYGMVEQRYFPNFELATLVPVFVVFGSAGETAWEFDDINRKDLIYVVGFGARFAQTKSISRLINKLDVSIPVNGARKGEPHYSVTTTYSL